MAKKAFSAVDLFCGAGGESCGIVKAAEQAGRRLDLLAVNHWDVAIETHGMNHPYARHECESIQNLDPVKVAPSKELDLLWASPECTNHSNAKGGKPRSEQSRASAWLILKWLTDLRVKNLVVENVAEFLRWGPVDSAGKPVKELEGRAFFAWVNAIRALGYAVDWRLLTAADFGDPTTRTRLIVKAVLGRGPVKWPDPTHSESGQDLPRWVPARDIIDWSVRGESIFSRKKPLAEATLNRIERGMTRFWGDGAKPFLTILRGTSTVRDIARPLPSVTTSGAHFGLCEPLLVKYYGTGGCKPVSLPLDTVTTKARFGLLVPDDTDLLFRMLKAPELARGQGFPACYRFSGKLEDQLKQIGNAVPPGLAFGLASCVFGGN